MDFCSYLESIGYAPHRFINGKMIKHSDKSFSKMEPGMMCIWYKRGTDLFCWGLHEVDKPPTLISPRPFIILHVGDKILAPAPDDCMNQLLQTETPEELYNSIFNSKVYDFIKHPNSNITRA